jgi:hypothetical protein
MDLSHGQRVALANLARKQAGEDVEWISIADARSLTEAGFAERSSQGWKITAEGAAALKAHARASTQLSDEKDCR